LTAASTGTPSKAEEPRPNHKINNPVYTDTLTSSVQGVSQGGGLAQAVAGLVPNLLAVMPDVPFLCHFRRALDVSETNPYEEITRYLSVRRQTVDQVFSTLSYFDAVNFAKRANAPALFSVALRDLTCPPSTV